MNRDAHSVRMLLPVLILSGLLFACMPGTTQGVSEAFDDAVQERDPGAMGVKTEIEVQSKDENDGHRITAAFILSQNGMDSDIDAYNDVHLVKYHDSGDEERFAVVVDQKDVYFPPDAP